MGRMRAVSVRERLRMTSLHFLSRRVCVRWETRFQNCKQVVTVFTS